MKNLLIFIILLFTTLTLNAQSQWEIFDIPYFTGYNNNRKIKDVSMINADIGFVVVYSSVSGGNYGYVRIFNTTITIPI